MRLTREAMTKRKSIDNRLEEFISACEMHSGEGLLRLVSKALADRHFRLVAKAAVICSEQLLYDTEAQLIDAYRRLLDNPVKRDPHCIAKGAIVRALVALDCQNHDFFSSAMRYRQLEPTWGGSIDTALDLRNSSAMGLVGTTYPRAAVDVAELLTDNEAYVRIGALRALACVPQDRSEPLLRFKALSGDPESEVVGECFTALIQLEAEDTFDFVAAFMNQDDLEVAGYAALALGESRYPPALNAICDAFNRPYVDRELRRILVRAAVLQRNEPAYRWLLNLVSERDTTAAEMVIEELGIYRSNAKLKSRLETVLIERNEPALMRTFNKTWNDE